MMGPIAMKLAGLRDHIRRRTGEEWPLSLLELQEIVGALDALVPLVDRLERRAQGPQLRVIDGRRNVTEGLPPPPSAA